MRPYITVVLCMLFSLTLVAEEVIEEPQKNQPTKPNISENENLSPLTTLIDKIKTSKSEDRRELMNKLKIELRAMNRDKRQKTMRELKKSFAKGGEQRRIRRGEHQQPRHQPRYLQLHRGGGEGGGHK